MAHEIVIQSDDEADGEEIVVSFSQPAKQATRTHTVVLDESTDGSVVRSSPPPPHGKTTSRIGTNLPSSPYEVISEDDDSHDPFDTSPVKTGEVNPTVRHVKPPNLPSSPSRVINSQSSSGTVDDNEDEDDDMIVVNSFHAKVVEKSSSGNFESVGEVTFDTWVSGDKTGTSKRKREQVADLPTPRRQKTTTPAEPKSESSIGDVSGVFGESAQPAQRTKSVQALSRNSNYASQINNVSKSDVFSESDDGNNEIICEPNTPPAPQPARKSMTQPIKSTPKPDKEPSDDDDNELFCTTNTPAVPQPARKSTTQPTSSAPKPDKVLTNIDDPLSGMSKAAQKELEKERKAAAKEQAQAEKARKKALEDANKQRRNHDDIAKELILDVHDKLFESDIGTMIRERFTPIKVEVKKWQKTTGCWQPIRIRRKVTSVYDPVEDIYKPCELQVQKEKRAFIFISGADFSDIVENGRLEAHIGEIRQLFPLESIVYLIQGLDLLIRKAENAKNREYTTRVRQLMDDNNDKEAPSSSSSSRKKKPTAGAKFTLDRAKAEEMLVYMQIESQFKIVHTCNDPETSEWICSLAQSVAIAPYKTTKLLGSELVDFGNITSGKDMLETFAKSLQQIKYVTPPVSSAVSSVYPNVDAMMRKFANSGTGALSGIRSNNRRALGQKLATSIHDIFTSKDPDAYLEAD